MLVTLAAMGICNVVAITNFCKQVAESDIKGQVIQPRIKSLDILRHPILNAFLHILETASEDTVDVLGHPF